MKINIPQHHTILPHLLIDLFEEDAYDVPEWEISVPQNDDVPWSIVLSYLTSANFRYSGDFESRLKTLTGSDEDAKLVKKAILSSNPFVNRFVWFFNDSLKQVVSRFKENMKWDSLISVPDKLSVATKLLKSPILLITNIYDNDIQIFIDTDDEEETQYLNIIALVASQVIEEDSQNSCTFYNFMLSRQLGFRLKQGALRYYLFKAGLSKKHIHQAMSMSINEHFLISLIKNDFKTIIFAIYKSPYIVSKLIDAGYDVDPKSTDDDGFSALYHALIRTTFEVVFHLYFAAVNICFDLNSSYRNPDSHVVNNLNEIEKAVLNDLSNSNDFKDFQNREEIKMIFDQFLKFNNFFTEVVSKTLKIRRELNNSEAISENVFQAIKRRDIIVSILNSYEQFFKTSKMDAADISPLEDYIKHKYYYFSLDVTTAVCFFDNIIYLKERLALENNAFSDIEASFMILVLFQVLFNETFINIIAEELPLDSRSNIDSVYAFPVMQRELIISKTKEFSKTLQDKVIKQDADVLKFLPENEVYGVLQSFPEIKDHLQIIRLKSYINIALEVKVVDIKSVLIIERALQVLGEYMKPETDKDFSVIRRVLPLCLPKGISHILRQIRHELTHLKSHFYPSKFKTEKNYFLFQCIQKEISYIKMCLKPAFKIQKLREVIYATKQFEGALKQIMKSLHLYRYNSKIPFYIRGETFFLCRFFPNMYSSSFASSFLGAFKTILRNLEDEITNDILNISDSTIDEIKYKLWPLKFLLEQSLFFPQFIENDGKDLLKMFKEIEECRLCNELDKNVTDFIKQCNKFISTNSRYLKPKENREDIKSTEEFLKHLKGFTYLSDYDKKNIRKEIPSLLIEDVAKKNRLIASIERNDYSLSIEEQQVELEISYLSKKNKEWLKDCYLNESVKALEILKTPDPITELEEVFSTNCVSKQSFKSLCAKMHFSDETRKKLSMLVPGLKQKPVVNSLSILINRIKLLREILIEDNKELSLLWSRISNKTSQQFFLEKIVEFLLRNKGLQTSGEMLLFDCMTICEKERSIKNTWIKSCKLYSGINLRNVISHGNPLLECLCSLLDPDDLLTEITCKILRLIECEDTISAILELYDNVNHDFAKIANILYSDEPSDFEDLKKRVLKRHKNWELFRRHDFEIDKRKDWEIFMLLLPDNPRSCPYAP